MVTVSYFVHYGTLLKQNPTDIATKCFSFLIAECVRFLLQNAKVLLQNAIVITKCNDFITKCDVYYKIRRYTSQCSVICKTAKHLLLFSLDIVAQTQ